MSIVVTTTCLIKAGATRIELLVLRSEPAWYWEMRLTDGLTLDEGQATTRLGAQLAAQAAFERRLRRSGLHDGFAGYRWNDAS